MGGTCSKVRESVCLSKYVRPRKNRKQPRRTASDNNNCKNEEHAEEEAPHISRQLGARCEAFRRSLEQARGAPLGKGFVRGFNEVVAENPCVLEWRALEENGRATTATLLWALYRYLCCAIEQAFPLKTYRALVTQTPRVLAVRDGDGYVLLHHACWHLYDPNGLDIVSFFAELYPDAAKATGDNSCKQTPLHIACLLQAPLLPAIRVLVDANPRAMRLCDWQGNSPLHDACRHEGAPPDVIQYLVGREPGVCLCRNWHGKLPLDCADPDRSSASGEFMATATTAAARALAKRLCFNGPAPREIFEQVAGFLHDGRCSPVETSAVNMALSSFEIAVLFQRDAVRTEFRNEATK